MTRSLCPFFKLILTASSLANSYSFESSFFFIKTFVKLKDEKEKADKNPKSPVEYIEKKGKVQRNK